MIFIHVDELKKCEDRDGTPPSSQNIINNMDRYLIKKYLSSYYRNTSV